MNSFLISFLFSLSIVSLLFGVESYFLADGYPHFTETGITIEEGTVANTSSFFRYADVKRNLELPKNSEEISISSHYSSSDVPPKVFKNYYTEDHLQTTTYSYNAKGANHYTSHKSPSDTSASIGQNHVVLLVSGLINIYNKSDPEEVLFSNRLSSFFQYNVSFNGTNHAPQSDVFDSRVYHDKQSNRFFIVTTSKAKPNVHYSRCILAVSAVNNPMQWKGYTMVGYYNNHWIQFPMLGMNEEYIVISTKAMDAKTLPLYSFMNYNHIYVIDRNELLEEGRLRYAVSKGPLSGPKSWDWQPCRGDGSIGKGPLCVVSASATGFNVGEVYLVDTTIMHRRNTITSEEDSVDIDLGIESQNLKASAEDKYVSKASNNLQMNKDNSFEEFYKLNQKAINHRIKNNGSFTFGESGAFNESSNVTAENPMLTVPDNLLYPTPPSTNLIAIYKPLNKLKFPDDLNLGITPAEVYQLRCSGVVSTGGIRINSDIYQDSDNVIYAAKGFCTEKGYINPDKEDIQHHSQITHMRAAYGDTRSWVNRRKRKPMNIQDDDDTEYNDDDLLNDYKDDDLDDSYDESEKPISRQEDDDNDRNNYIDYDTPVCIGTVGIIWVAIDRKDGKLITYDTIQDPYIHYFYPSITAIKDQYAVIGFNGASDYGFIGSYYSFGTQKKVNESYNNPTDKKGETFFTKYASAYSKRNESRTPDAYQGSLNRSKALHQNENEYEPPMNMYKHNYTNRWTWTFHSPVEFQEGLHSFCRKKSYKVLVPWGDYSTTIQDPLNSWITWTFQTYVPHRNRWQIRMAKIVVESHVMPEEKPRGNGYTKASTFGKRFKWISVSLVLGLFSVLIIFYVNKNFRERLEIVQSSTETASISKNAFSNETTNQTNTSEIIDNTRSIDSLDYSGGDVNQDYIYPFRSIDYVNLSRDSTSDSMNSQTALLNEKEERSPQSTLKPKRIHTDLPVPDKICDIDINISQKPTNSFKSVGNMVTLENPVQALCHSNKEYNDNYIRHSSDVNCFSNGSYSSDSVAVEVDERLCKMDSDSSVFRNIINDEEGGIIDIEKARYEYTIDYIDASNIDDESNTPDSLDSPTKIPLKLDMSLSEENEIE